MHKCFATGQWQNATVDDWHPVSCKLFGPAGKKCGAGDQRGRLIGPTKGGLNTKSHAVTDAKGRSLKFLMTAGQGSDNTAPRPWAVCPLPNGRSQTGVIELVSATGSSVPARADWLQMY